MTTLRRLFLALSFAPFLALAILAGCMTKTAGTPADPAQVARIAAMAESIVAIGAQGVLAKNPEARPQLLAVAEAIEQAIAMPNAPKPTELTNIVLSALGLAGPYGQFASLAVRGGLEFYRSFYAANASTALDAQPAFKAVLVGLAKGIRSATPAVAGYVGGDFDLVLRPARQ